MKNKPLIRTIAVVFATALCATVQAAPLALDTSALTNDWNDAAISAWRCREAFRNFGEAVAKANAEAAAKRTKLDTTARVYLKSQMEKAQSEGDLDRVLVFKTALESARGGEISGDDEAVVKLRESYDKQIALTDKALLDAGLAAARSFAASLDEQKKEVTKKGDIDDARKIATFQKKVREWTKAVHGQARQTIAERPTAMQRPKPQPRPPVREVKPTAPAARIVTVDATSEKGASIGKVRVGDTIEIQYVGGGWVQNRRDPLENPDVDSRKQLLIVEGNQDHATITRVPRGTKGKPFRHQAVTDGEIMLRMEDTYHGDNAGSVRYSVRVIPAAQRPQPQSGHSASPR